VVDDHLGFRTRIRRLLERHGYRVVEAADGHAGVRLAAQVRPDIALVDIHLPDTDGFEVAVRLRAARSARTIILTSTHRTDDYRERLATSAADGFIDKADLAASSIAAIAGRSA
jgi:DNA-binding response OmpR family regulator